MSSWSIETKKLSGDVKYHTLWEFEEPPEGEGMFAKLSANEFVDIIPDTTTGTNIVREALIRETTITGAGNRQELKYSTLRV